MIYIGPNIRLVVLEIRKDLVRLGIEAPREIEVLRGELVGEAGKAAEGGTPAAAPPVAEVERADSK